jgi:hypothetical protein
VPTATGMAQDRESLDAQRIGDGGDVSGADATSRPG